MNPTRLTARRNGGHGWSLKVSGRSKEKDMRVSVLEIDWYSGLSRIGRYTPCRVDD